MGRILSLTILISGFLALALAVGGRRATEASLSGDVRTVDGPVSGVRVRLKATPHGVVTGADGSFRLPRRGGRVTAAKEGFFIAGSRAEARPLSLTLTPLPAEDNEEYEWVDPAPDPASRHACANCHSEIYREWSASAHARSATGSTFLAAYRDLVKERPDGAAVCNACHAPSLPAAETLADLRTVRGVATQGVHCDYCHKVEGIATDAFGRTHGRYNVTLRRPRDGQLFFGPLDDVDRGDDAYSPFSRDSRYCASCHEGVVFGVPVYTTYSEWLTSPARRQGKQCQTCHMAPTGTLTNLAPGRSGVERDPLTLGNHRFFDGSRAEMLRRAVTLKATWRRGDKNLFIDVEVRADGAGHRVPTGFVDRNLLLHVEAVDGSGSLLGKAHRLYAKLLRDADGNAPVAFWRADPKPTDTRLEPGVPDRATFAFPPETRRVVLRLVDRRSWTDQGSVVAETVID